MQPAKNESEARQQYLDGIVNWSRAELLSTCRAGGLSAHQLKINSEIAELLWIRFGKAAWLAKAKAISLLND